MRLLIDILHPAHVHFFRHLHTELTDRGHDVVVTSRDKDLTIDLLDSFGIPHTVLSAQGRGALGLGRELASRSLRLLRLAKAIKPDAMVGIMGPAIAPVARLRGIPSLVFYDTETATATNPWVFRLARWVCVPEGFECGTPARYLRYPGTQEFAYLHPNRFTPDASVVERHFGIARGEPYSVVRFVSWEASHDRGDRGLSRGAKEDLLRALAEHGRVLISIEGPVPRNIPGEQITASGRAHIHDLLAFSMGIVGDSGTMSLEAAALGRPALYLSTASLSVIRWMEQGFGLIRQVDPRDDQAVRAAASDWGSEAFRSDLARGSRQLHARAVDVTDWMVRLIEKATAR